MFGQKNESDSPRESQESSQFAKQAREWIDSQSGEKAIDRALERVKDVSSKSEEGRGIDTDTLNKAFTV
jgi:hypothetical protein